MPSSLHDIRKEVAGGSLFLFLQSISPLPATRVKPQLLFRVDTFPELCLTHSSLPLGGVGPSLVTIMPATREGYSLRMKKLVQDKHLS